MQLKLFDDQYQRMNYANVSALTAKSVTKSTTLDRWTFLVKRNGYVALDYWRTKDLIRWYPNGTIVVIFNERRSIEKLFRGQAPVVPADTKGYYTDFTDRKRVNMYLPFRWHFFSYRHHTMMMRLPPAGDQIDVTQSIEAPSKIEFDKDGNVISQNKDASTYNQLKTYYDDEYYKRDRLRARGRYWVARARNLYLDRTKCKFRGTNRGARWECGVRRYGRGTIPTEFKCGCRTYRKPIGFRYSVKKILDEPNATVRTAMIKLYGYDKFFKDANAKCIHSWRQYKLLRLQLIPRESESIILDGLGNSVSTQNILVALKMECPSTGQIYVNLVPPNIQDVAGAVDWMYNIRGYFKRIAQAT